MDFWPLIAFFVVGMLAGTTGGLLGLSGGVVTVPCLVLLFHLMGFPQLHLMHMAIGTSLSAMVLTGIASTWAHHNRNGVMWEIVLAMVPGIILGCLLGTFLANFLSGVILQIIFGVFVLSLGTFILLQKKKAPEQVSRPAKSLYTWIGLGIGTAASILGIGGGIFMVPLLMGYHYPERKAVGTSCATGLLITILAALGYLYFGMDQITVENSFGYVYLPAFALIGIGTIIFAPIGVKLAHVIDGKKLRRIFAATLILVGILMIFN